VGAVGRLPTVIVRTLHWPMPRASPRPGRLQAKQVARPATVSDTVGVLILCSARGAKVGDDSWAGDPGHLPGR
jgi:hypothetical protein